MRTCSSPPSSGAQESRATQDLRTGGSSRPLSPDFLAHGPSVLTPPNLTTSTARPELALRSRPRFPVLRFVSFPFLVLLPPFPSSILHLSNRFDPSPLSSSSSSLVELFLVDTLPSVVLLLSISRSCSSFEFSCSLPSVHSDQLCQPGSRYVSSRSESARTQQQINPLNFFRNAPPIRRGSAPVHWTTRDGRLPTSLDQPATPPPSNFSDGSCPFFSWAADNPKRKARLCRSRCAFSLARILQIRAPWTWEGFSAQVHRLAIGLHHRSSAKKRGVCVLRARGGQMNEPSFRVQWTSLAMLHPALLCFAQLCDAQVSRHLVGLS